MDKEDIKSLFFHKSKLKDLTKFILKSYMIILEKYGYDVEDWYFQEFKSSHNLKRKTLTKVLHFYHVKNVGLEMVKITCVQDKTDNMKTITHYKSSYHLIIFKKFLFI